MIPAIGFMVGSYIITRMVQFIFTKDENVGGFARFCAGGTILITLGVMAYLFFGPSLGAKLVGQ